MATASEQTLLERAAQFDQAALAEVFDLYNAGIYRYAMRLLGDPELARECMSETFKRYLNSLAKGAGPKQHLQAYLYRVAHNWITDYYRSKTPATLPFNVELRADTSQEPHQAVADELERQRVRQALTRLTPDQRQVITLRYLEEWDIEQIAQALNKPVGAVKALQHRAIESLKRILHE